MKATSNKDMLNAIRNQASAEYQDKVPVAMDNHPETFKLFQEKLTDYPSIKNEFVDTLINKVVRTDFFSKIYENPLKMLKKGSLAYGASIEELFVMAAEAKGFYGENSHWNNAAADDGKVVQPDKADLLISTEKPDIKALYITKNFAHVFKTSISDAQLKAAFTSANGLSELVNQIVGSLTNGAEQQEFKDMKTLIKAVCSQKRISTDGKGLIIDPKGDTTDVIPKTLADQNALDGTPGKQNKNFNGVLQTMYKYNVDQFAAAGGTDPAKNLAIAIRALAGRLKFVSTKYNMAGVPTWSRPEDLVLLTTPEIMAEMDVDVLAEAFNISKAEMNVRTILVDELPTKWFKGNKMKGNNTTPDVGYYYQTVDSDRLVDMPNDTTGRNGQCYGILMDKAFIQAIDTVNEARQFENGRSLTTNLFLHRQGMLANCYFANCIALFDSVGYGKVSPKNAE